MFNGDPRRMTTDEAAQLLGAAGWLVKPKYERVEVVKDGREFQLAYSTPTSIAVYTQDVEWLLSGPVREAPKVSVHLSVAQSKELFEQYHEDTHILQELGITVSGRSVEGDPDKLRELAKLIAQDYDPETGFETVSSALKRAMLRAADRISHEAGV